MSKKIILFGMLIILTGCSNVNPIQNESKKEGVVDACYTVMEYNPTDKKERIQKYLESKVKSNDISKEEKEMLERCLERTEKSNNWVKP